MDSARHDQIGQVFLKALDLARGERQAYLDQACSADEELRAEVESLLAAEKQPTHPFLEHNRRAMVDAPPTQGDRIGQFVIKRMIGLGGMGTVFEAEQERPRRRVAIKTMRPGVVRPSSLRRFEYESQVLALLRHPGIAQVYEAGIHETLSGEVPYFVMEFVPDARPIDDYVRRHELSIRQQLELFVPVCEAVEHAHQNGVIHRDLKPENVLVDGLGQTKVIDFGIARLMQADGQHLPRHTTMGEVLGTLPYLSPEQAIGDSSQVDTRTDVYGLGVILYETVTGRPPFSIDGGLADAVRDILHVEPAPPHAVNPFIDGELETILLKCLQKDRDRRYQSAGELGRDIQRYLRGEAIEAKHDSGWYMLRKTVRRYRAQTVAAASITVVAATAAIALSFMYSAQKTERHRAEQAAVVARLASDEAAAARSLAERRASEAERHLYIASIVAADAAIARNDGGEAVERLQMAPERLRNWEWFHLLKRADLSSFTFPSTPESANHIAFSPRGQQMAMGYYSGMVRVRDVGTKLLAWEQKAFDTDVRLLAYTADGIRLVVATVGGWCVLDAATGQEIARHEHLATCESPAAVDQSGVRVAFHLAEDCTARDIASRGIGIYALETGELIQRFPAPNAVYPAAVSSFRPGGEQIATGDFNGLVHLWDIDSGRLLLSSQESLGRVYAVAFSPDGRRLVSGHEDGTVVVWDTSDLKLIYSRKGHSQRVWKVVISRDGVRIASTSQDKSVRFWNMADGSLEAVLRGHGFGVTDAEFSSDGNLLATVAHDGVMKVWEVPGSPEVYRQLANGPVEWLAFDGNGSRLVKNGGAVLAVDTIADQQPHELEGVPCAVFSKDGAKLIVGHYDGTMRVLDIATSMEERRWSAHNDVVLSVALSHAGKDLASASWDGQVMLWDAHTGQVRYALQGHTQAVRCLAFSPDDSMLASASLDGTVRLWNTVTGACVLTYAEHTLGVYSATFSPDGNKVASASNDSTFRIWNPRTGETLMTIDGKMQDVWSIAYSPDGRRLVTGARDRTVRIWDAETGDELLTLRGPTGTVMSVAWSPDGRRIAAGSWNRELFIWDIPSAPRY